MPQGETEEESDPTPTQLRATLIRREKNDTDVARRRGEKKRKRKAPPPPRPFSHHPSGHFSRASSPSPPLSGSRLRSPLLPPPCPSISFMRFFAPLLLSTLAQKIKTVHRRRRPLLFLVSSPHRILDSRDTTHHVARYTTLTLRRPTTRTKRCSLSLTHRISFK